MTSPVERCRPGSPFSGLFAFLQEPRSYLDRLFLVPSLLAAGAVHLIGEEMNIRKTLLAAAIGALPWLPPARLPPHR